MKVLHKMARLIGKDEDLDIEILLTYWIFLSRSARVSRGRFGSLLMVEEISAWHFLILSYIDQRVKLNFSVVFR
jgi:hypothetical protein